MTPRSELKLTREQQTLFLDCRGWLERMTERLIRRFQKWVPKDEIPGMVEDAAMECAARYEPARGVPFEVYALKGVVFTVMVAARKAARRLRLAYKACSSCSEVWLADPNVIFGTDEARQATLDNLAEQGATAMVLASVHSRNLAEGGEDAMIAAVDSARMRAAAATLSSRSATVLELRYGEREEEISTISELTGLGVITVRRAHAQALDELRAQFV